MWTAREQKPEGAMEEALRENHATHESESDGSNGGPSMLTIITFAFLTFNSATAVYSAGGGLGAVSFVGFSFVALALLFYSLRLYERAPPGSPRREHLKMAVWLLATMLAFALFPLLEFCFLTMGKGAENSMRPA